MKVPLTKDRAAYIQQGAFDIQQSAKRSILSMRPELDDASYADYLDDARSKYGFNSIDFDKKINSLLPINTAEKFDELIQLKAHEVMVFSYFAFEHRLDMESDHAWLCMCLATKAGAMLEAILFSKNNLHAFEKGLRISQAKKGGLKRGQKYDPLKAELLKRLKESVEKDGKKWTSVYFAACQLQDVAVEIAEELNIVVSSNGIRARLEKWFNDFPERDTLFASKRTNRTSKHTADTK